FTRIWRDAGLTEIAGHVENGLLFFAKCEIHADALPGRAEFTARLLSESCRGVASIRQAVSGQNHFAFSQTDGEISPSFLQRSWDQAMIARMSGHRSTG